MATFCLTGRATTRLGAFIERRDVIRRLGELGHGYHDAVYSYTDYLVASRTDTQKAQAAARNGTRVITYAELWDVLEGRSVAGQVLFPPSGTPRPITSSPAPFRPSTPRPSPDAIAALAANEPEPPFSDRGERIRKINI